MAGNRLEISQRSTSYLIGIIDRIIGEMDGFAACLPRFIRNLAIDPNM